MLKTQLLLVLRAVLFVFFASLVSLSIATFLFACCGDYLVMLMTVNAFIPPADAGPSSPQVGFLAFMSPLGLAPNSALRNRPEYLGNFAGPFEKPVEEEGNCLVYYYCILHQIAAGRRCRTTYCLFVLFFLCLPKPRDLLPSFGRCFLRATASPFVWANDYLTAVGGRGHRLDITQAGFIRQTNKQSLMARILAKPSIFCISRATIGGTFL